LERGGKINMSISWGIPGTKTPLECNIYEIIKNDKTKSGSLSEVIIAYHKLDEKIIDDLVKNALTGRQACLFRDICSVKPQEVMRSGLAVRIYDKFFPRTITWGDYAAKLGWEQDDFINTYSGTTHKVFEYIKKHYPDRVH
jgi:hypothetical protein